MVVDQMEEGGTAGDFKVAGLSNLLSGYLIITKKKENDRFEWKMHSILQISERSVTEGKIEPAESTSSNLFIEFGS